MTVPLRVTLLWVLVAVSAFTVLLWPLNLVGLSPVLTALAAVVAGLVTGVAIARASWRNGAAEHADGADERKP